MSQGLQPGDIAMVKAPYVAQGRGAVVTVVRRLECGCCHAYWEVNGWVGGDDGLMHGPQLEIAEECLRKLRDDEGEDETLRIAGKPQEHVLARLDALQRQMDDHMRRLREVAEKVNGVARYAEKGRAA
ncbi:MAG TPA: hypothetical protein VLF15_01750 [Pseudoxanthomonas sp.]|nr:hypothetical protein [Pseudoxanthomonas sp.]